MSGVEAGSKRRTIIGLASILCCVGLLIALMWWVNAGDNLLRVIPGVAGTFVLVFTTVGIWFAAWGNPLSKCPGGMCRECDRADCACDCHEAAEIA